MTFTIVARDKQSGDFGICVSSFSPAIGWIAPFASAQFGVLSYQSSVEPRMGEVALGLLEAGYSAQKVLLDMAQMDRHWEYRQVGVLDSRGGMAVFTGSRNRQWAGHRVGSDYIAFGNVVAGEATIDGICDAWEGNRAAGFDERLLRAIEGGRDAGGQLDGQTSAAIKTFGRRGTARLDLRCDHAAEPIAELRRLVDWSRPLCRITKPWPTIPRSCPGTKSGSWSVASNASSASRRRTWHKSTLVMGITMSKAILQTSARQNMSKNPSRSTVSRLLGFLFASAAVFAAPAFAQTTFPAKPIRMVVPFPAGASPDVTARFIAERLGKDLGQPVVIDNRPGASQIIGTDIVAKAPADGHTLLYTAAPSVSLNPHVFSKLPYKASDLVPVIHVVEVPFVMIVRTNSPFKSVHDLLQAAKKDPGKLNYATYGDGTPSHIAGLQFMQQAGTTMTAIPYKDGGILSVMSGDVDFSMEASAAAIPQIKGGKLRALAVSANGRMPTLPGVPVLSEILPGNQLHSWNGIFAPRGTPQAALDRLSEALQKIVASSEFQQNATELGLIPVGGTQAQFRSFLAKDYEEWGAVVKRNGIHLD